MRLIILAVLLSSCSMVHKTSNTQMKDSTAVITNKSKQFSTVDSLSIVKSKEIETADLVVVLKDTATGFVILQGDSLAIPAAAVKEIRSKRKKEKQNDQSTQVITDQAILTDTKQSTTVKEKTTTKEKKKTSVSWMWAVVIIAALLLYISRKRIYAIYKAFTI